MHVKNRGKDRLEDLINQPIRSRMAAPVNISIDFDDSSSIDRKNRKVLNSVVVVGTNR